MERVKEVLQLSFHLLESARSSNGGIAPLSAIPESADRPLIAAVEAAKEIEKAIFDGRDHVIVIQ